MHLWCASGSSGKYIESFSGSAALYFHIQPEKGVLIDCNSDLQECLTCVKESPIAVSTLLLRYKKSEAEYYKARSTDTAKLTKLERAARFIFLNRYCFNGLYRTNMQGKFNVPFGGNRSGTLPSQTDLINASSTLKRATIVCGDFYEETLLHAQKDDYIYMDPPYAKINKTLDNQYGPSVFGTNDLRKLSDLLKKLNNLGATFTVSYADCDEIQEIASQWTTHTVQVRRVIAASTIKRGMAKEILITNF